MFRFGELFVVFAEEDMTGPGSFSATGRSTRLCERYESKLGPRFAGEISSERPSKWYIPFRAGEPGDDNDFCVAAAEEGVDGVV